MPCGAPPLCELFCCDALNELLGESAPFGEFRGDARGEEPLRGERGEDVLRCGDRERNDGRELGEAERAPAEEARRDRGLDGVRARGVPPLEGVAGAAGDLARCPMCTSRLYFVCAARFRSCCILARYCLEADQR